MESIGEHSLNNRIHGECRAIAEQHPSGKNEEFWKMFFKIVAVRFDEYPVDFYPVNQGGRKTKVEMPKSLGEVSDTEANKVHKEIQVYADERGYWLWEYRKNNEADHLVYRSLAGRTFDEMQEYIKEILEVMAPQAEKKDPAEAQRLRDRADELSVTRQSRFSAKIDLAQAAEEGKKNEPKQLEIF